MVHVPKSRFIGFVVLVLIAFCQGKPKDSADKPTSKSDIEIIFLNVVSTVQARFATTLITSQVANRADSAKEITFTAQLPDAAFISNFSMQIGEQIVYGDVKEKEKAKADFDAAKARGESTGLVAKKPRETNAFTISVNVAAQSKVRFNLTYQELLKRVHGVYKQIINLQPDQPVSELKVDVYITERGEITKVKVPKFGEKTGEKTNKELQAAEDEPNVEIKPILKENGTDSIRIHYQPKQKTKEEVYNGQLVVLYDVKRDKSAGDIEVVNGYFVHFFAPEGLQKRPKDIFFVLDKSGSMQGRKMSQLKDAMKVILNDLNSEDKFWISFFSDNIQPWRNEFSKATPENVKAAVSFVQDTEADGGTNIYDSLQDAIRTLKSSSSSKNVPMILFLTDGQPTVGETSRDKIVNETTKANDQERKIIIHSVAFGEDADYGILQKISGRNRGLARRVYEDSDSSIQLAGFYEEISSPVLTELKIDYLNETVDVSSIVQDTSNNYYDGSELVVVGRLRDDKQGDAGTVSAKVTGQSASGDVDIVSHSHPRILCRDPIPLYYYDVVPADEAVPVGGVAYYRPPIWCCPPPYCCYWRRCIPPPTPAPKEPLPASSAGGFIERVWAYQTIKKLLRESDLKDGDAEKEKAKKQALELSLKYHFVTELTSMVVVKPNDEKPTTLEEDKSGSKAIPPPGAAGGSAARGFGGPVAAVAPGPLGPADGFAGGPGGAFRPPPPPPPPPASQVPAPAPNGKSDESKPADKNNAGQQTLTTSPASVCHVEVILVKENATVNSTIDLRRGAYASDILTTIQSNASVNARVALVDAFSDGEGAVIQGMGTIATILDLSKPDTRSPKSNLTQIIDAQFGQYATANVKRYLIFMVTSTDVQNAVSASTQARSHGVAVYAVSFVGDNSKTLSAISQDPARVYTAPPSVGSELGGVLSKCG